MDSFCNSEPGGECICSHIILRTAHYEACRVVAALDTPSVPTEYNKIKYETHKLLLLFDMEGLDYA
jgi:hypothetical protein